MSLAVKIYLAGSLPVSVLVNNKKVLTAELQRTQRDLQLFVVSALVANIANLRLKSLLQIINSRM